MTISNDSIFQASILIVDDKQANIELLSQLLTESSYLNVSWTMNPLEVSQLHQKNRYDLILLDLHMPVMDGFEVLEALKDELKDGYLPVLVITAQPGNKLRALQAGAKDFISKPFDLTEVKTRIRNMLEVRLLYKELENHNKILEAKVLLRTAELRESEARYRRLTELASDCYWEQDEMMNFTKLSGPVLEILGIKAAPVFDANTVADLEKMSFSDMEELHKRIASRQPFLDFSFSRVNANNSVQQFKVSGEPIFNDTSQFIGYRGIAVEVTEKARAPHDCIT